MNDSPLQWMVEVREQAEKAYELHVQIRRKLNEEPPERKAFIRIYGLGFIDGRQSRKSEET